MSVMVLVVVVIIVGCLLRNVIDIVMMNDENSFIFGLMFVIIENVIVLGMSVRLMMSLVSILWVSICGFFSVVRIEGFV